jgi:hypothetical protein
MRILIAILSLVLVAAPVLTAPATAQTTPGSAAAAQLSLPPDHQYEKYEPSTASYTKVSASQVPGLIRSNASIYDRTAKQWVFRPGQGLNTAYAAGGSSSSSTTTTTAPGGGTGANQSGWERVHGHVETLQGSVMTFRADDGQLWTVDLTSVSAPIRQALKQGEGATVIGSTSGPSKEFRAQYVQQDSSDPKHGGKIVGAPAASPSTAAEDKSWQRIPGQVQSVQGSQLTLKADDGRTISVNMKDVDAGVQKAIKTGERVTVIGHYSGNQNTVAARYVQQEAPKR